MGIFRFSVGSDAKDMAVPCVYAIGVVCWANCFFKLVLRLAVLMMSLDFSSFLGAQANYQDGRVFFRMGPGHVFCL